MHIWIVSQYYTPEPSSPSTRLGGFAQEWQKNEASVSVLTGTPNHPDGVTYEAYQGKPAFMQEEIDGVRVYRHWIYKNPDRTSKTRMLAQLSLALSLLVNFIWPRPKKPDVVIASTPSLLPAFSAWLLARRYGARFVFETREPWPAMFIELGRLQDGKIIDFFVKLQTFLYKRADLIITLTKGLAEDILDQGIREDKIQIIPNGFPDAFLGKGKHMRDSGQIEQLRTALQISPMTKIVMFLGEHDTPQALGQVIDAAKSFLSRNDVLFLFVGSGPDKTRLKSLSRGMPNVQFIQQPPAADLWLYYGLANVCLVTLKDISTLKKVIPSKVYEILGAARPAVVAADGITANTLNQARTALVAPPEESDKLAYAILKLIDNPEKAELLGEKAKQWIKEKHTHSRLAYTYLAHMRNILK